MANNPIAELRKQNNMTWSQVSKHLGLSTQWCQRLSKMKKKEILKIELGTYLKCKEKGIDLYV